MKIIAEIEDTMIGTIAVVEKENNLLSVGTLNEDGSFEEKHIDISNLKSAINVMAFYLQGEATRRKQLEEKLANAQ